MGTRHVLEAEVGDRQVPGWFGIDIGTGYAAVGSMVTLCPRASSSRRRPALRASGLSRRRVK